MGVKAMAADPCARAIRAYQAGDASAMARLHYDAVHTLGPRGYAPEQLAAWAPAPLDPAVVHARAVDGRVTLVAVNNEGEVVAYADMEADGHIDQLYCRPDVAGSGVASRLLDALIDRALAAGMRRLYVEASELARPLFERKGFALLYRREFDLRGVAIHNYAMERR
jgi:putative acetyltransferase